MHKRSKQFSQLPAPQKKRPPWGLMPRASRLGLWGFPFLLLGLCDVAARLHSQVSIGAVGVMLRLSDDLESIMAGLTILVGGMLLLDYMERQNDS